MVKEAGEYSVLVSSAITSFEARSGSISGCSLPRRKETSIVDDCRANAYFVGGVVKRGAPFDLKFQELYWKGIIHSF